MLVRAKMIKIKII